jgi:hypothetical protein
MVMYRAVTLLLALTFAPSVAVAQQPCTTDARQVVNELYRHMLERNADAGSNAWVNHLQQGGTVRDLVRAIALSDEHEQRFWRQESGEGTPYVRAVGTIYRHILGRQPDEAGARDWAIRANRSGMDAIVNSIINSAEYNQQFGDWGVPGSGGLRYCGSGNQGANAGGAGDVSPIDQPRFRGMDRNNDGVITRAEWRGNRQAFENQDRNNDGVLSGAELDAGAARRSANRLDRFETLDVNNNNRIDGREWNGTVAQFNRLDVNGDNWLSRSEFGATGVDDTAVATSGDFIRVEGAQRWTDTGIDVRVGDTITFDAQGTVRISNDRNDIAGVGGTLSGRREANAPLPNQVAGALIARIGNSAPMFIGNRRSVRAPFSGRIYLGINDDYLNDNSGDFQVTVAVQR